MAEGQEREREGQRRKVVDGYILRKCKVKVDAKKEDEIEGLNENNLSQQ